MNLILNIDTAMETASVCLADNGGPIAYASHTSKKDHASWLHVAIKNIMSAQKLKLNQLKAIAVSEGPGSYTGLRVGMASAKGLCYALNKPLITVPTLKMMAFAARNEPTELLIPMIDARRMEVFTAIYTSGITEIASATNMILDENSFQDRLNQHTITFFGCGSNKFKAMIHHPNAFFSVIDSNATHMIELSKAKADANNFTDLAYSEPFYGKDFHSNVKHTL